MRTAIDIIRYKGDTVWSVGPDETVLHALGIMSERNIGAVVVLDSEKIIGIFTERDYARKVVLAGRSSRESSVQEVMTNAVICVAPEESIENCLAIMTEERVRHLPVVDSRRLVGLISIGDLVHATIKEQEQMIEHLQQYIAG